MIGEGPRWNATEQRLYWVDFIENQNIHSWDPATGELKTYRTEAPVTALGFRRTDGLIVATGGRIATYSLSMQALSGFKRLIEDAQRTRGSKSRVTPKAAAFALLGMINWIYQWYRSEGAISEAALVDQFTAIIFAGVLGA